jgi:hypothetical protein
LLRALALCACLALPAAAGASETVQLHTSFSPDVPGASTTVTFGFTVHSPRGEVPSQLRDLDLQMPAGIGIARNTLGQAICEPIYLYVNGPEGCPENSRVGFGAATAEVPYGPEVVHENAHVYAYRGNPEGEHTTVLFFVEGWEPVFADLVFPGHLLEDTGPFSGQIDTEVPIIPSLPGAADVSVVYLSSSFGPQGITYHRKVGDREVHFKPRGVTVPFSCPSGGYPFEGNFTFQDGTHITAHSAAPCAHKPLARRALRAQAEWAIPSQPSRCPTPSHWPPAPAPPRRPRARAW